MSKPVFNIPKPKFNEEACSSSSPPTSQALTPFLSQNVVGNVASVSSIIAIKSSSAPSLGTNKRMKSILKAVDAKETPHSDAKKKKKVMKLKPFKDPLAPKKPKSAFMLFCDDLRPTIKEELGNIPVPEMGKELGRRWSEVQEDVKAKYLEVSAALKVEYEKEVANYTPSKDFLELKKVHEKANEKSTNVDVEDYFNFVGLNWQRIDGAISGKEIQDQLWEMWSMSSSKKVKGTSKTKKVKDPNTPKRPPSAYLMFLAEMREEMKKSVGGGAQVDNKQFASSVAEQWKVLDSDIKQPYISKYEALMEEYKVAKENYQKE